MTKSWGIEPPKNADVAKIGITTKYGWLFHPIMEEKKPLTTRKKVITPFDNYLFDGPKIKICLTVSRWGFQ